MNTKTPAGNQNLNQAEASFIRKNKSGIIDAVLVLVFCVTILLFVLPADFTSKLESPVTPGLYIFITLAIYRLTALLLFKGTVGMYISKTKLLNGNLEPLSKKENIFASFFILINGAGYYEK
jgi:uncharacterized RDD family membrane protein YckC